MLVSSFFVNAQAKESCFVDDRIMYAIASIEAHRELPIGYPFIISLNSQSDYRKLKNNDSLMAMFLDRRTINCKNEKLCVTTLKLLNAYKITNLDLGAFQLNYIYWKLPVKSYFNVEKSYLKACQIVSYHNTKDWSFKNIAKYHSKTPKYNERYSKLLVSKILKLN